MVNEEATVSQVILNKSVLNDEAPQSVDLAVNCQQTVMNSRSSGHIELVGNYYTFNI